MKKIVILLSISLPLIALLAFSLTRNPQLLPSALIGKEAPHFDLQSIDGDTIHSSQLRHQPFVLNFWSTWCSTCMEEYQLLTAAKEAYTPKGVLFFSVLYEDTPDAAHQFIRKYGKGSTVLIDPNLQTAINYGVAGVPETFFIDDRGRVVGKQTGMLTSDILEKNIALLIQDRAP